MGAISSTATCYAGLPRRASRIPHRTTRFRPHLYFTDVALLVPPHSIAEAIVNRSAPSPRVLLGLALLALLVSGCASSRVPPPDLTASRNAVTEADQAGAVEAAPLAMRNARMKLDEAQRALNDEDYERAKLLAEQAQVDAEYAEAKARAATAQAAVDELRESIRVLRDEIERNRRNGN